MPSLDDARKASSDFLIKTLNAKDVKIIKMVKADNGWEAEAEVYEESSFIKALGLPTRVQDRNIYTINLNDSLQVQGYEKQGQARLTE